MKLHWVSGLWADSFGHWNLLINSPYLLISLFINNGAAKVVFDWTKAAKDSVGCFQIIRVAFTQMTRVFLMTKTNETRPHWVVVTRMCEPNRPLFFFFYHSSNDLFQFKCCILKCSGLLSAFPTAWWNEFNSQLISSSSARTETFNELVFIGRFSYYREFNECSYRMKINYSFPIVGIDFSLMN